MLLVDYGLLDYECFGYVCFLGVEMFWGVGLLCRGGDFVGKVLLDFFCCVGLIKVGVLVLLFGVWGCWCGLVRWVVLFSVVVRVVNCVLLCLRLCCGSW